MKGSKKEMEERLRSLLEMEQQDRKRKENHEMHREKLTRKGRTFLKRIRNRIKKDRKLVYRHINRNYKPHREGEPDYRDGPYQGAYRAVTWNAQGLFAAGRKPRKAKWKFVQELAKKSRHYLSARNAWCKRQGWSLW